MSQEALVPEKRKSVSLTIDGYQISMHFSEKPRPDVYHQIRQMLLSSPQEKRICTFVKEEKV